MTAAADDADLGAVPTPDGRVLGVCRWGHPDGAPVLWLHGMPGSRLLRHVGDGYVRHRLRVYTYDRPGYGLSTRVPGRRPVDAAAEVRALADAVGLDRFGVAGVSAGASSALAVAALLPERVTRCAVVAPLAPIDAAGLDFHAGMGEDERAWFARIAAGGSELAAEVEETRAWVRDGLPGLALEGPERSMLDAAFREAFRQGPDGCADDFAASLRPWGFAVEDVAVPTRVMVARDDTTAPPSHGAWLADRLPDADLVVVDGDHFGPRDEPEMALLAWLGSRA
jgi:pimeloyl-ACP methyl ester carboxylesterase